MSYIFIPGNTPSLKNSKQIVRIGKLPRLIPSKAYQKYAKATKQIWIDNADHFRKSCDLYNKPYTVAFYFVRDSKRKFDYDNAISTCLDLMTEHGWLDDDNMENIIPVPVSFHVDKENAGVFISAIKPLTITKPEL